MKFAGECFAGRLAQCLLNEPAGIPTRGPLKALGLNGRLADGADRDLNDSRHVAPPICTVNLIVPSGSCCSVTVCPC